MFYENPLITFFSGLILGILGLAAEIFYSHKGKKELKQEIKTLQREQETKIEEAKQEAFDEAHRSGLAFVGGGLAGFDDKVCELVTIAKKSIRLCLSTPLLHAFKEKWIKYDTAQLLDHPTDHWARLFCEQLRQRLIETRDAGKLRVEIVYLDDKVLKSYVENIPEYPIPFPEYKESLQHFFATLRTDNACTLFTHEVPDIPIYMAIIDGPDGRDMPVPPSAQGVVAFMSASEFMKQRVRDERTPKQMADSLQVYQFSNPEVVRFFTHLFNEVSLHGDQDLLKFLNYCRRHDWKWAVITEGMAEAGEKKPYASLIHAAAPLECE
jgi:hypothetical protein